MQLISGWLISTVNQWRTQWAQAQSTLENGSCCCAWECSHWMQGSSMELLANLRARVQCGFGLWSAPPHLQHLQILTRQKPGYAPTDWHMTLSGQCSALSPQKANQFQWKQVRVSRFSVEEFGAASLIRLHVYTPTKNPSGNNMHCGIDSV